MSIIIYLASENKNKYDAVRDVFQEKFPNKIIIIHAIKVLSFVPEQPINNQTVNGAKNRIQELFNFVYFNKKDYDYLVSIENGIMTDLLPKNLIYDTCVCYIYDKKNIDYVISPVFIYFNIKYYEMARKKNKTVGEIIESENNFKHDTWHYHISGISRYKQIRIGLLKLLGKMNSF